jgi:hypothetical protein
MFLVAILLSHTLTCVECRGKFRPIWSSSTEYPDNSNTPKFEKSDTSFTPKIQSEADYVNTEGVQLLSEKVDTQADRNKPDHSSGLNDKKCETPGSCTTSRRPVAPRSRRQPTVPQTSTPLTTETANVVPDDVLPPIYAGGLQISVAPRLHLRRLRFHRLRRTFSPPPSHPPHSPAPTAPPFCTASPTS